MPSKKQKRENKAEQKKKDEMEAKIAHEEEQSWTNGINKRALMKAQLQTEKQEEKMRSKQETQKLLETEENMLGPGKKTKSKKYKNDDMFLLNQALSTMPKTKAQKEKEKLLQEKQERKTQEELYSIERTEKKEKEIEYMKELQHKNIVQQDAFSKMEKDVVGTIDDALHILDSSNEVIQNKTEFNQFYEKQLPLLQKENPNLRRHQYREHIYKLWKRAIENPNNQK